MVALPRVAGVSNTFPAYEIYMSNNGGAYGGGYQSLYQYMPSSKSQAIGLFDSIGGTLVIDNAK